MDNATHSCYWINYSFPKHFLSVVFVFVFIFGLLSNCWGLKSIFTNWRNLGNIKIFALNLCVADILYIFTLPFLMIYQVQKQKWNFGQPFCKITRFLFNVNLYGSIGFLACISVYRYLGIVHTLKVKGRIRIRHSIGIAALVWIMVLLQCLPDVWFDKTFNNRSKCYDTTSDENIELYLRYSITQTVIGFVIPLVLIVCCYGHTAMVLATKKDIGNSELKLKCLRMVVVMAVLFLLCFTPFHIFRNLNLMTRISKMSGHCKSWYSAVYTAKQISDGLACLNSAINPVVYMVNSDQIMKRILRGKQQEAPGLLGLSPVRSTEERSNLTSLK